MFLLSFLKVKKDRIVLHQPFKFGYDCNPKYIAQELIRRKYKGEIIWITRGSRALKSKFPPEIKVICEEDTFKFLYYFATAGICISNSYFRVENYHLKKKNQVFINTWHGALGIKKIGTQEANIADYDSLCEQLKNKMKNIDIFISNSDFETEVYRNALLFDKKIYKFGHPRNDIFFEQSYHYLDKSIAKQNIEKYLKTKISEDTKMVLYAPTFRETSRNDCFDMDYNLLLDKLEEKFNQKFILALRFHPRTYFVCKNTVSLSDRIFDLTDYGDMQGLMAVSDIMITDYSSCIFDFMLMRKAGFIYASDLDLYNTERGLFYPLESTPFPIIRNNEELKDKILHFDYEEYKKNVENFLLTKGCLEDGNASERTVDLIEKILNEKK